jgi:hypothetical protein
MPSIIASVAMASVFFVLPSQNSILIQLAYVLICAMTYIVFVSFFKEERRILFSLRSVFIR